MSNEGQRSGRGCSMLSGLGCGLFIALIAGGLGLLAGMHGLQISRGPGIAILDVYGYLADEAPVLDQLDALNIG